MKKVFVVLAIIILLLEVACSSDNSSGPELEQEQVVYVLLEEGYNSSESIFNVDYFEGYIPDLNKKIVGESYKIFSYEFDNFERNFEYYTYVLFTISNWSNSQMDNVNNALHNSSTVPIEVVTNVGTLTGEVDKIMSVLQNVQYNGNDPATVEFLLKDNELNISWEYPSTPPEKLFLYIYYTEWMDGGNLNTENIKLVEKIIEGNNTSYLLEGDLLNKEGVITIEMIPINGAFVTSEDNNTLKEPNMTGDGIGYFYIFADDYRDNVDIAVSPTSTQFKRDTLNMESNFHGKKRLKEILGFK